MDKVRLTIVEGGRDHQVTISGLSLTVGQDSRCPLPVDVRIFEEDTHLVLTVDPVMHYTEEHPVRLMTSVMETQPNRPGSVVINNASWYAVVHDLDSDLTCRAEWIENAYRETFLLAEKKRVQTIGLPLLGSVHGKFSPSRSLEILIRVISRISFQYLRKIRIIVAARHCGATRQHLHDLTRTGIGP